MRTYYWGKEFIGTAQGNERIFFGRFFVSQDGVSESEGSRNVCIKSANKPRPICAFIWGSSSLTSKKIESEFNNHIVGNSEPGEILIESTTMIMGMNSFEVKFPNLSFNLPTEAKYVYFGDIYFHTFVKGGRNRPQPYLEIKSNPETVAYYQHLLGLKEEEIVTSLANFKSQSIHQ